MSNPPNPFNTLQTFDGGKKFYSLPALEQAGFPVSRLPVSIRLVLEAVLRNCDGKRVMESNIRELAAWKPTEPRTAEIPFVVARIVLQDFTGVPLLVDLAAMRSAVAKLGKNPKIIEPLVPVDLVVDHSVQVDFSGNADALRKNLDLEFSRNRERYQFLKWGMQAFDTFKVVPPGIGIVHQVNLEYLAKGVLCAGDVYYPDTLVGTDSHTTMINGIGIVGWGVGGIEAEAGMLGQPVYFLTPDVVGVYLTGALKEGVTATDLALTVKPYVSQRDCAIAMDLLVTKNEPDFVNVGARGDPSILTKTAKTSMLVQDGETSVLGGIYTRNTGLAYKKVPFLADLPVLGWLFKDRKENDDRTEILVFITPKITNKALLHCQ